MTYAPINGLSVGVTPAKIVVKSYFKVANNAKPPQKLFLCRNALHFGPKLAVAGAREKKFLIAQN
jgi:hypothetical protein